jgi:hypothetical protein
MNEHQPWEFTCKTCGGHQLNVYRVWEILAGTESETWQEWGPLEADHHWHFRFKEKIEKAEKEDSDRWNFAKYTKDLSSPKPGDFGRNPDIWIPGTRKVGSKMTKTTNEAAFNDLPLFSGRKCRPVHPESAGDAKRVGDRLRCSSKTPPVGGDKTPPADGCGRGSFVV